MQVYKQVNTEDNKRKMCKVEISKNLGDLCELIESLKIAEINMSNIMEESNLKCCNYCEVDLPMEEMIIHVEENHKEKADRLEKR